MSTMREYIHPIAFVFALCCLDCISLQTPSAAQTLPISVAYFRHGANVEVTVTNHYVATATAWAVGMRYLNQRGNAQEVFDVQDQVPIESIPSHKIGPNGSIATTLSTGSAEATNLVVEPLAVVYDDGTTDGDATIVRQILLSRAATLVTVPRILPALAVVQEQGSPESASRVLDFVNGIKIGHRQTLSISGAIANPQYLRAPQDRDAVAETVALRLSLAIKDPETISAVAANLISDCNKWESRVTSEKPDVKALMVTFADRPR